MNKYYYFILVGSLLLLTISCDNKAIPSTEEPKETEKPAVELVVDPGISYQSVTGFGGMDTQWQGSSLSEAEVTSLFGKEKGQMGYNILRVRISPNGESDWEGLVATVKKAKSFGALILASPWTPPASLKTNNSLIQGEIKDYAGYAAYLKRFVQYMKDKGAAIDVLSLQNEPDIEVDYESCQWSPSQILSFVKNYGDVLRDTGIKLLPAEPFQFNRAFSDPLLEDESALSRTDIIGGHIYGGGLAAYPAAQQKGKEVWMTEHLLNSAWQNQVLVSSDALCKENMAFATEVSQCMEANFNAYIWWYLRRFYSMIGDGTAGTERNQITARGYMLAHFAQFATGRTRVKASFPKGTPSGISVTAYKDTAGKVAVIIVNASSQDYYVNFTAPGTAKQGTKIVTSGGRLAGPTANFNTSTVPLDKAVQIEKLSVVTVQL